MDYKQNIINLLSDKKSKKITTNLDALNFYVEQEKTEFTSVMYEPSLCVILQGKKDVSYNDEKYGYDNKSYLISTLSVPAKVQVTDASKDKPYICSVLTFSLEEIYNVMKETGIDRSSKDKNLKSCLCLNTLDDDILEPLFRLTKLALKSERDSFLINLTKKEIIYALLQKNEALLKQYVLEGSIANQVARVVADIKENFDKSINIKKLSKNIGISESSLYQNFKKITTLSPLQFQKKIRLEEAKKMLVSTNKEASDIAFLVGYESPSQFSREYARMFGMPPKAHCSFLRDSINL